ncbi:MAG: ankyrin repeat protein [Acidimicrobiales bacterium]|nr:ankyrin repeat protein [Acidimicrobiales bacterium]
MTVDPDVRSLIVAIGSGDRGLALRLLEASKELASAALARSDEFFLEDCLAQLYAGDTALHAAAFAYDTELAHRLVELGADVRARNRRGAEPLHAATIGSPGTHHWDPPRQCAVILALAEAGADPNAAALGGVTPLHRAVRNRCSAAVEALLSIGADPHLANDKGSRPADLARLTTGRGGTGSVESRAEQALIIAMIADVG